MKTLQFQCRRFPLVVRLVEAGDRYGRDGALVHGKDGLQKRGDATPLVEFYDGDQDFEQWTGFKGQFITRYDEATLRVRASRALMLDGGCERWTLEAAEVEVVQAWLRMLKS